MTRVSKPTPIQAAPITTAKQNTFQKSSAPSLGTYNPYVNELEKHHQITRELKTIGIITAILLPLLVILAVVLGKIG